MNYLLTFFVFTILFSLSLQQQTTQLCGDKLCTEKLFATNCVRNYNTEHQHMLNCVQGETIKILGIKLSSRPDFLYGEIEKGDEKTRGNIFVNFVDIEAYVFFLENAIENNEKLQLVQYDVSSKRMNSLAEINAIPELIKDYSVYVQKTPGHKFSNKIQTIIETLNTEKTKVTRGHGHSHEHGHSHQHLTETLNQNTIPNENPDQSKKSDLKEKQTIEQNIPVQIPIEENLLKNLSSESVINNQKSEDIIKQQKIDQLVADQIQQLVDESKENKLLMEKVVVPIETQDLVETKNLEAIKITEPVSEKNNKHSLNVEPVIAEKEETLKEIVKVEEKASQTVPEKSLKEETLIENKPETLPINIAEKPETVNIAIPVSTEKIEKKLSDSNQIPFEDLKIEQIEALNPNNSDTKNKFNEIEKMDLKENNQQIQKNLIENQHLNEDQKQQDSLSQPDVLLDSNQKKIIDLPVEKEEPLPVEPIKIPDSRLMNPHNFIHRQQIKNDLNPQLPPLSNQHMEIPLEPSKIVKIEPLLTTKVEPDLEPPTIAEKLPDLVVPIAPVEAILTETPETLETNNELKHLQTADLEHSTILNDASKFDIHTPSKNEQEGVSIETAQYIKNEEFCHKEECQKYSQMNALSIIGDKQNSTLLAVRSSLNQMVEPIRLLLPDPFNRFDTTGLFVFGFLLISICLHMFNVLMSTNSGTRDVLDKKTLHDCITRIKEQDVLIGKYRSNESQIQQLQQNSKRVELLENEKIVLGRKYFEKEQQYLEISSACNELNELYINLENELKQTIDALNRANELLVEKENNINSLEDQLNKSNERATTRSTKINSLKSEIESQRNENDRLQSELQDEKQNIEKLNIDLQISTKQSIQQKTINEDLQNQVDELLAIVAELKCKQKDLDNSLDPDENGGSNGWSDLGDVEVYGTDNSTNGATETAKDEEGAISDKTSESSKKEMSEEAIVEKRQVKEKLPNSRKWSADNLFEIAKLKTEIRKLETERNNLKLLFNSEQQEKVSLTQRLEQIKQELTDKRKEAEIRETNRHDLQAQCTKFLDMINEKDRKLETMEVERERLREKISQTEATIRDLEDEKREISLKLRECDQMVRKTEESNGKLENKLYHEERRLNNRIRQLEEQLTKAQSINSVNNSAVLGDLNMSRNSSEREFGPTRSEFPSLWSDIDTNDIPFTRSPYGETNRSLRQRAIQQPTSSNSSFDFRQSQAMSRSSPFELEEIFSNKTNKDRLVRPNRARSRSTGRQSAKLFSSIKGTQNFQNK